MDAHTNREYNAWQVWLDNQWNIPTRDNYYNMQVAQRVQQVLSSNPNKIQLKHQKIDFTTKEKAKKKLTEDEKSKLIAQSKAVWHNFLSTASKLNPISKRK